MTLAITFDFSGEIELRWVGTRTGDNALSGVLHGLDGDPTLDLAREEGG